MLKLLPDLSQSMQHHALEIQEILSRIFQHYHSKADLASLARTCRTFNDPAMDALWKELDDLRTLAKCLPDASHHNGLLSWLHRSLTPTEWNLLHNRTRRIRTIFIEDADGLDEESLKMLSKPPTTETLFSNVRYLRIDAYTKMATSLSLFSFPSLLDLSVYLFHSRTFWNYLESLPETSPRLTSLAIDQYHHHADMDMDPSFLCRWQYLQIVACPKVYLNLTSLTHLSRMPALTELHFTLPMTLPDQMSLSDSPLFFSSLRDLQISSEYLCSLSRLLSGSRLPAITYFTVEIRRQPSKRDLASFFINVHASGMGHSIQNLSFVQSYMRGDEYVPPADKRPILYKGDLELCMQFSHLRRIRFDVEYQVDLTESDLFTLTSTWPHLEEIAINSGWGWNSQDGLTPNGLLQLLWTRPTLTSIALAIDTRGYTEILPSPSSLGFTLPKLSWISVVDSFINAESVPAITAFFDSLKAPACSTFIFHSWRHVTEHSPHLRVCEPLWNDICARVNDNDWD